MGRDSNECSKQSRTCVSIHTPLWGATTCSRTRIEYTDVSIHTPLWGATSSSIYLILGPACFNPHAPMGRDQCCYFVFVFLMGFNPHAPMGRDQLCGLATDNGRYVSIHTPLWGATLVKEYYRIQTEFQSTRPYGARHLPA